MCLEENLRIEEKNNKKKMEIKSKTNQPLTVQGGLNFCKNVFSNRRSTVTNSDRSC